MSTRNIALRVEAYERLCRARIRPGESFSDVVLRAWWPNVGVTAAELLARYESEGPFLSAGAVDGMEAAKDQ